MDQQSLALTGISGRNESPESETVEPRKEIEVRKNLHEAEHDAANDEGGDGRAHEGQGQDGPDVPEEEPLLHAVAGVEDDRRQDDVEENLRIEGRLLVDLRNRD